MEENQIDVLLKYVGEEPRMERINNTLEEYQRIVGGYIECVSLPQMPRIKVVWNEEGSLLNLKRNTVLDLKECGLVTVYGNLFFAKQQGDSFISLTDKDVSLIKDLIL